MTELQRILEVIGRTADCTVAAPRGQPRIRDSERLPDDLAELYRLCGGVSLFDHADYAMRIVGPDELVRSNPEIIGDECPDDITDSWYIVARGKPGMMLNVSIDCAAARLGRCYDSFWDRHGVVGSCPIVALSFTELLQRLFDNRGGYLYWLADGAPHHRDAYDDVPDPSSS